MREQSRSFADAGRRKSLEAVPRPTGRTGGATEWVTVFVGRSCRRNGAIQTNRQFASPVLEVNADVLAVVVRNAWLGNWEARKTQQKNARRRDHIHESDSAAISLNTTGHRPGYPRPRYFREYHEVDQWAGRKCGGSVPAVAASGHARMKAPRYPSAPCLQSPGMARLRTAHHIWLL